MNARLIMSLSILSLLLAACAPAAPNPIATSPRSEPPAQQEATLVEKPVEAEPYRPQPTAVIGGNTFQDYGVNPEQRAQRDHLSTFALDVDTASYTVARRFIEDGSLPPIDAVRVEEFVNAFDQGYESPSSSAFTIYADGAPDPFDYGDAYLLRFGIQGYRVSDWERKPLALTFVIDVSGSMDLENRLGLVKETLEVLVEGLDSRDSVAIVVYGSDARLVLEPTPADRPERILRAIRRLRTEGSTNVEAGLKLGYRTALQAYRPGSVNRVILCSDGVANTGETRANALLDMIGGYVSEGVDMTALGFGMGNFNDVLLEQLADKGNGFYAYIDTLEEAERLFIDELTSSLQTIAYDAKVQVDFNQELVAEYRLLGYENRQLDDQDFRDDSVDAGEIGAGHTATAIYQVRLRPGAEGRIATVQLRWQDAETREIQEINGNFNTWDLYPSFEESDAYFQKAVLVAAFAEVLRASPYTGASLGEIAGWARQLARQLPYDNEVQEFSVLADQAVRLAGNE